MAHHRDIQFPEVICIANTREHEQLWRVDGAPAQDHFPADISLEEAELDQSHFLKSQLFDCPVERHPVPATAVRAWPLEMTPLWRICSQALDRGQRRGLAGWPLKSDLHRVPVGLSVIAVTITGALEMGRAQVR